MRAAGWSLTVLALAAFLRAAPPPNAPGRMIKIPMWVDAGDAGPLAAQTLKAKLEGADSRIVAVKGPGDDLMLLVVLDLTEDLSYAETAKEALITEVSKLPERTYLGVLRAQDGLNVLLDPTADRDAATKAIQEVAVSGRPGLLETVETAERLADSILSKSAVRVAVLYVTDSDVHNYREDYTNPVINSSDSHDLSRRFPESLIQDKISKLKARLSGREAPLFVFHLRYRSERLNEAYQNGLKQAAEVTGGAAVFCRSSGEIESALHRVLEQIASHYSVTLAVPERANRNVQILLEAEGNRTLSYRTRFDLRER